MTSIKEPIAGIVLSMAAVMTVITGEVHVRHFVDITRTNDPMQFWLATMALIAGAAWYLYLGFFDNQDG